MTRAEAARDYAIACALQESADNEIARLERDLKEARSNRNIARWQRDQMRDLIVKLTRDPQPMEQTASTAFIDDNDDPRP